MTSNPERQSRDRRLSVHSGFIVIAQLGSPCGLAGDMRIRFYSNDPDVCRQRAPFYVGPDALARQLVCTRRRPGKGMDVAHFEGIDTREAAGALTGLLLYQERAAFAPAAEDEYYLADLIGMEVVRVSNRSPVGVVTDVMQNGANEVVCVCGVDTGMMLYLPFTHAALPDINLTEGVILAEDVYLE